MLPEVLTVVAAGVCLVLAVRGLVRQKQPTRPERPAPSGQPEA